MVDITRVMKLFLAIYCKKKVYCSNNKQLWYHILKGRVLLAFGTSELLCHGGRSNLVALKQKLKFPMPFYSGNKIPLFVFIAHA
jgi:hypothetical protein